MNLLSFWQLQWLGVDIDIFIIEWFIKTNNII